jgi:hypothetical protein
MLWRTWTLELRQSHLTHSALSDHTQSDGAAELSNPACGCHHFFRGRPALIGTQFVTPWPHRQLSKKHVLPVSSCSCCLLLLNSCSIIFLVLLCRCTKGFLLTVVFGLGSVSWFQNIAWLNNFSIVFFYRIGHYTILAIHKQKTQHCCISFLATPCAQDCSHQVATTLNNLAQSRSCITAAIFSAKWTLISSQVPKK